MRSALTAKLCELARLPRLLVACDYDGTLADIVTDPARALPDARALNGLRSLSEIEQTTTAVVSGRSFDDLITFLGSEGPEIRVGSHGAEWTSAGVPLTVAQHDRLRQLSGAIKLLVEESRGLRHEIKPAGVALHVRAASPRVAEIAVSAAVRSFGSLPGVYIRRGSKVVEFMVVPANKGDAVLQLKHSTGADGVLFVGDDLTDEDVFKVLKAEDVGVRVGPGDTHASHRVQNVTEVGAVLDELASWRRAWLQGRRDA